MSLPLLGAGMATDGPSAVLDLNFASLLSLTPSVGPTPSFTRASTGTYFNSSGVLTTAAINGPRFDHVYNGSSWVSKGLLIEEARTNINLYSEQFNNAAYTISQGVITVNQASSPDGNTTAENLTASAGTVNPYAYAATATANGSVYVFSIYVKKNTHDFVQVVLNGVGNGFANFNISSGVVGTLGAGGSATSLIVNVGNGWYRCIVTYTTASTSGNGFINLIGSAAAGRGATFTAVGTESVFLWGQQLELGAFPTSYIPTTTAAVTRSADVCQITGGDFSGFWNASEGSFVTEADSIGFATTGSDRYIIAFNSGGSHLMAHWIFLPTTGLSFDVYNSTLQARLSYTQPNAGVLFKLASAYKANDFAATLNGSAVQTDTSGTVPTINNVGIGYFPSYNQYANCHIARLRYFNTRLTNATLRFFSGGSRSFQPDNISGLQFWVDANDSATLYTDSALTTLAVADGDVIGGWKDKSGNSRNALQTDGTKKPLLKLAIQNGRNVVRTDGVDDLLNIAYDSNGLSGFTLICVVKKVSPGTTYYGAISNYPNSVGLYVYGDSSTLNLGGRPQTGGSNAYNSSGAADPTLGHVSAATYGVSLNIYIDGVAGSPAGPLLPAGNLACGTAWMIGPVTTIPSALTATDYCEILMYNSELAGANRQLVEAYLKAKWGTP